MEEGDNKGTGTNRHAVSGIVQHIGYTLRNKGKGNGVEGNTLMYWTRKWQRIRDKYTRQAKNNQTSQTHDIDKYIWLEYNGWVHSTLLLQLKPRGIALTNSKYIIHVGYSIVNGIAPWSYNGADNGRVTLLLTGYFFYYFLLFN